MCKVYDSYCKDCRKRWYSSVAYVVYVEHLELKDRIRSWVKWKAAEYNIEQLLVHQQACAEAYLFMCACEIYSDRYNFDEYTPIPIPPVCCKL